MNSDHELATRQEHLDPQEIWTRVERNYQRQRRSLNEAGLLEFLPEQDALGIRDSEGKFYPFPSSEVIMRLLTKNDELIQEKWPEGFTKLLITPMALSLSTLYGRFEYTFRQRFAQHRLFTEGRNMSRYPLHFSPEGNFCHDINSLRDVLLRPDQLYFPNFLDQLEMKSMFSKNAVIQQTKTTSAPGWSVSFIQEDSFLPNFPDRESQIKKQEIAWSPADYLEYFKKHRETGFTLEDALAYFLLFEICEQGLIVSGFEYENALFCCGNYGSYMQIPVVGWSFLRSKFIIDAVHPRYVDERMRARSAVRLK